MRKLIIAMCAIGALLFLAGPAQADKAFSPTCGKNPPNGVIQGSISLMHQGNPNRWTISWSQLCGSGGSVEREVQKSTDGGNHWVDLTGTDGMFTTSLGNCCVIWTVTHVYPSTVEGCSQNLIYRAHVWDYNSDYTAPLKNGC